MKITLKQQTLENFKGTKKQVIDFGNETGIYAANGEGKTRCYDGYLWNLTGKDSKNRADYKIKTICTERNKHLYPGKEIGEVIHNLEYSSELVFDVDGQKLVLKRIYKENWVKKRNELKSHTTEYHIDELKVAKNMGQVGRSPFLQENQKLTRLRY